MFMLEGADLLEPEFWTVNLTPESSISGWHNALGTAAMPPH